RRPRVDDRALGRNHAHGPQDAVGEGDVGGEDLVHADDQLRADDLGLRVEEVRALGRRPAVVEHELPAGHAERAADEERLLVEFHPAPVAVLAAGQLGDARPQHALRAPADRAERRTENARTHLALELDHLLGGDVGAGHEALQIYLNRRRLANVVEHEPPDVVYRLAAAEDAERRHAHALLIAVAGARREAAGHHAAHVDHVPRRARPADARPAPE